MPSEHKVPKRGVTAGPDFLCVGQGKAGTNWLLDQLQYHPDFWMPPIKELHYLDTRFVGGGLGRALERRRKEPEKEPEIRALEGGRPLEECDADFYDAVEALAGKPLSFEGYSDLFRYKGDRLSGDITPAYAALSDETISLTATTLPDVRIVVLIREPVDRMWSQVCMAYRLMEHHRARIEDPQQMAAWAGRVFAGHAYATRIVSRWQKHFGDRLRWFFYDDIAARPEWVRREILSFIGGDADKPSGVAPGYNWKQGNAKLDLGGEHLRLLVEMFRDELRDGAEMFGGRAAEWPKRYGL